LKTISPELSALIAEAALGKEKSDAQKEAKAAGVSVEIALKGLLERKAKGKSLEVFLKARLDRREKYASKKDGVFAARNEVLEAGGVPEGAPKEVLPAEVPPRAPAVMPVESESAPAAAAISQESPLEEKKEAVREKKETMKEKFPVEPGTAEKPWMANTDGACEPNPGEGGIGGVLVSPSGRKITISERIGPSTNNTAEYTAVIRVLEKALEAGVRHLVLHSDSQLVVNQVLGAWSVNKSDLGSLRREVLNLAAKFDGCRFRWVRRE